MGIFDKLFNPFSKNKYGKYQDISKESQRVAPNPPSELLLYCRDIAGVAIQKFIESDDLSNWLRMEYTYPAFDSMNFQTKNKIFSVIIDIQDDNGDSYLPEHYIKRQLYASKTYNLIPCKFPVIVSNPHNPDYKNIKPKTEGLNLFHTENNSVILPSEFINDEQIEISLWEIRYIGIRFVINYLYAKGYKILSFQDTLEVDPQIWFLDKNNRKCWAIVRCGLNNNNKKLIDSKNMNEIIRRCFKFDGYYAEVIIEPKNKNIDKLYRLESLKINFDGLVQIHKSI